MSDLPSPRKPDLVYYGWVAIGIAILGAFLSAGTSQILMGLMVTPIMAQSGWSRTVLSLAIALGTFGGGMLSIWTGRWADRHGMRVLATLAFGLLGVGYVLLWSTQSLMWFFVAYFVARTAAHTLGMVIPSVCAVAWFTRMRGRALGLAATAVPLGSALLALFAQALLGRGLGPYEVFAVFGALTFAVLWLPWLFLRDPRKSTEARDDREVVTSVSPAEPSAVADPGWTLLHATHTASLWLLIGAVTLATCLNSGTAFTLASYFLDRALPIEAAAYALSAFALSGAAASLLWGYLIERYAEHRLAASAMLLAACAIAWLLTVRSTGSALLFAAFFGFVARGESSLTAAIIAAYFGRSSFGSIIGFVGPFQMAGLALGPLLASALFEASGSYFVLFALVLFLYLVAAALFWFARKPRWMH